MNSQPQDTSQTSQDATRPAATGQSSWKHGYHQNYYREHRKAERLTPEELERCRQHPALAREIRGSKVIACLGCGLLLEKLPQHLAAEHGMRSEKYRREWGFPKNYPLSSKDFSEKMAAKKKAAGYLPPIETRFGQERGPSPQEGVKARHEWGVTVTERQAKRDRALTEKSRQQHTKWWTNAREPKLSSRQISEISEWRLRGRSQEKIARDLKVTQGAVSNVLRKMGFPAGREFVLWHGEPLTRQHLPLLIQDYIAVNYPASRSAPAISLKPHEQLTVEEAAERLGVSVSWVRERTRDRSQLRVGVRRGKRLYLGNAQIQYLSGERERIRREELLSRARCEITKSLRVNPHWIIHRLRAKDKFRPLSAKIGDRILSLWNALKGKWGTQGASPKGGHPKKLLPSEEVALPRRYQSLRKDLKQLLAWLKGEDGQVSAHRVQEWICEQAQRGRMRILLRRPEFFDWIKKEMEHSAFLSGGWVPGDLATEFLAQDYGLAPLTVRRLVQSSLPAAPPRT